MNTADMNTVRKITVATNEETTMGITLFDNQSGAEIGRINQEQLQFLIDQLEEESLTDQDYYLNPTTLDFLKKNGADEALAKILDDAIAGKEGVEIRWRKDS